MQELRFLVKGVIHFTWGGINEKGGCWYIYHYYRYNCIQIERRKKCWQLTLFEWLTCWDKSHSCKEKHNGFSLCFSLLSQYYEFLQSWKNWMSQWMNGCGVLLSATKTIKTIKMYSYRVWGLDKKQEMGSIVASQASKRCVLRADLNRKVLSLIFKWICTNPRSLPKYYASLLPWKC